MGYIQKMAEQFAARSIDVGHV
ncbi:uncharacterized protein G2W53_012985 [Senna tora]|uniref:Uncharacterized protein n=1 Tax=Senna tora TaxID=362788 RepID=A0A834TZY6_9FABA|nr:uncharacterized protein G2W53_012985 [Senna tora]